MAQLPKLARHDWVTQQLGSKADAADLGTAAAEDAGAFATAAQGVLAEQAVYAVTPPPATGSPVTVADSGTNYPMWMGADRRTLYRGGGSTLKTSVDDGQTWQIRTSFAFTPYVVGIRDLANGELLVSTAASEGVPGRLYLSNGFPANSMTATWAAVLQAGRDEADTLVGPSSYFNGEWGMSTHENIAIVSEYGLQNPGTDQARFVWLSEDYGQTWARIYDAGTTASTHTHATFYDPWWKAIWVTQGDLTNSAIKYTLDKGATWTTVGGSSAVQVVGGIALPGCLLFGSDRQPDGVYRVDRNSTRAGLSLRPACLVADGMPDRRRYIGTMPYWTGRDTDPVLFPFASDESWSAPGLLVATHDGHQFRIIWRDTISYTAKGPRKVVGPTVTGTYLGELDDGRQANKSLLRLAYAPPVPASSVAGFTVRPGAGIYTTGDVITLGQYAFHQRSDAGTCFVAGGSTKYENVIGGNTTNVDTATSNLTNIPTLADQNGNWVFILSGYDNVVNGWACVVNGFHNKVETGGNHATISGGSKHIIPGTSQYGTIGGGTTNTIGGTSATVAGGHTNTASANQSTVSGGFTNVASGTNSAILGGQNNTASGLGAMVLGGQNNTASGSYASVLGGFTSTASSNYATASGKEAVASLYGLTATAAGMFSAPGDAQSIRATMRRITSDATPTALKLDGAGVDIQLAVNTTWAVSALVAAHRTDVAGESAAYELKFCCRRATGAVALIGTPTVTVLGESDATWDVAVIADGGSGTIRINVTGSVGKTIRWVASLTAASASA